MTMPGSILMGVENRLLPPSAPYSYFLSAAVFQVVAWGLLVRTPEGAASFIGGPGPILGSLHAVTLGVLVMAAMGASFQFLPVATGQSLRAIWPVRLAWWLFFPGVMAFLHGVSAVHISVAILGAGAIIAALVIYLVLIADVLRRVRDLWAMALHAWAALAALLVLTGLGVALLFEWEVPFLADAAAFALAHMIVAAFGFMGLLAMGFSTILVPMFALSPAIPDRWAVGALALWCAGLCLAFAGALAESAVLGLAGAGAGLAGFGVHVWIMLRALRLGMNKRLGLSFVLVRAGWAMGFVAIVLGALAVLGVTGERGWTLFGFLAVYGWLLTFLMGILQRIIPFLAAMNAGKTTGRPPLVSQLSSDGVLVVHAVGHFTALALAGVGIALDQDDLIFWGGVAGAIGGLAFCWFSVLVLLRAKWHWSDAGNSSAGAI